MASPISNAARVAELKSWHDDWSGLSAVVLGLGVTGFSAADTLVELGVKTHVIAGESDPERERLLEVIGATYTIVADPDEQLSALTQAMPDVLIVSPGYRPDHPLTTWAEQRGIPVWGDIDLAWRLRDKTSRIADWILVTGTNGKTTTTQLTAHMILRSGRRVIPVGNIGTPVLDAVRDPQGYDVLVVELSSFQLHRMSPEISPVASVCLNLSADHIDWHGGFEAYAQAKAKVYRNTRVACVYNRADQATERMVEDAEVIEGARAISFGLDSPPPSGFGVVEGLLVDRAYHENRRNEAFELLTMDELQSRNLGAPHLVANILAAAALARAIGVKPEEVAGAVLEFRTDAHRSELVAALQGVNWVDDSKATNAHAASASLRASPSVVWIVGGLLKGQSLETLIETHASRVRAAIIIGADRAAVRESFRRVAPNVQLFEVEADRGDAVMNRAVEIAADVAVAGDVVLLAPAAASMDQFLDYQDRGKAFQAAVRAMLEGRERDAEREG